jgi:hypothetical protein
VQAKIASKDPFKQYGSVRGLKVHYGSTTDYSTYPEGPFDVVYDNNGKDMDSCKMLIDAAKVNRLTSWSAELCITSILSAVLLCSHCCFGVAMTNTLTHTWLPASSLPPSTCAPAELDRQRPHSDNPG